MNSLKKLLLIAALALFASAALADHSIRLEGGLLIQQDDYQIYIGTPPHRYSGGHTYRTPRFLAPHRHKHRHFSRGHYRIRDPLIHDYRLYRHQRHYNYKRNYRPHRSERHFNRYQRSERHFNKQHRSERQQRHQGRQH